MSDRTKARTNGLFRGLFRGQMDSYADFFADFFKNQLKFLSRISRKVLATSLIAKKGLVVFARLRSR